MSTKNHAAIQEHSASLSFVILNMRSPSSTAFAFPVFSSEWFLGIPLVLNPPPANRRT